MPGKDGYVGQAAINREMDEVVFPSTQNEAHDPEQYQFEKIIGKRSRSGRKPLKRLTPRHKNIIALHLRCLSHRDIAVVTGMSEVSVAETLKDSLSQEIISVYLGGMEEELQSLAPMAVDALRSGLGAGDIGVRLKAADRFFRVTGRYSKAETSNETAEDVLARALARVAVEQSGQLRELQRRTPGQLIDGRALPVQDAEED